MLEKRWEYGFWKSSSTLCQLFAGVSCAELTELSSSLSFDCTSVGINPGYGSAEHRAGEKIKQSPAECYLYKYQQLTFNTTILRLDSTPFVQRSIGWSLHHQLLHWYWMCGVRIKYILYTAFDNWSYYTAWLFYVMSHESASKQYTYTTDLKGFICCPV